MTLPIKLINEGLLNQLPAAPKGKKGWPWTEQSTATPNYIQNGFSWPKISIVTPSFNQGHFLEETIRSVILQNYLNIEYIIIDGGSTDDSVDIIRKYEPWLTYWVSERDEGQSDAINKGIKYSSGAILAWINSDDSYCKGCFHSVASLLDNDKASWLIGATDIVDEVGRVMLRINPLPVTSSTFTSWSHRYVHQQAIFWNRLMAENVNGGVDNTLHYIMDYDFWYKMHTIAKPQLTEKVLARYRHHNTAKTISEWEKSTDEMTEWLYRHFLERKDGKKLFRQFIHEVIDSQRQLERISDHVLLGNIIRIWSKVTNRRFNALNRCRKSLVKQYKN